VNSFEHKGFIDWEWLSCQEVHASANYTRHLRFDKPITIKINGHQNKGIILKPGSNGKG
ncbi:MAG: hypothetical protein HF310_19630, partial [Ignavibacteria bacterium]|nr:hypothetical protein [Ignavibacteria bacterium]